MRIINIPCTLAIAAAIGVAGCNGSGSTAPLPNQVTPTTVYRQIERLSRPAVKEAFENFDNHDQSNRTAPKDDMLLHDSIVTFMETGAGRDATTLAAILSPDEMQADLSKSVAGCGTANAPCGAYLGVETGGATGNTFGGRWLNDDTIDISLGAIFGNTLSALGVVPDDHHESPCLTTDNVGTAQAYGTTFPYVNAPY